MAHSAVATMSPGRSSPSFGSLFRVTDSDGLQRAIGSEMEEIIRLLNKRPPEDLVHLPALETTNGQSDPAAA
jgi:hypothetical protein